MSRGGSGELERLQQCPSTGSWPGERAAGTAWAGKIPPGWGGSKAGSEHVPGALSSCIQHKPRPSRLGFTHGGREWLRDLARAAALPGSPG